MLSLVARYMSIKLVMHQTLAYYDGCGGNADYCPPNHHLGDDGVTCTQNGGSCACGEFYACPTASI